MRYKFIKILLQRQEILNVFITKSYGEGEKI